MTRELFMNELYRYLSVLPDIERREVMADYEEYFEVGKAEGRSEDEIADSLGDPELIATELVDNLSNKIIVEEDKDRMNSSGYNTNNTNSNYKATSNNGTSRALIAILLIFANMTFVLGPYLAVAGVLLSFWIVAGAFTFSGAAVIIAILCKGIFPQIHIGVSIGTAFFISLALSALGILLLRLMNNITRGFIKLTQRYIEFNLDVINGRR